MAETKENVEPIVRPMTKTHFKAICSSEFSSYVLSDENPVVVISKEIKDIQKEIEIAIRDQQLYERTLELIVKHQENFLHKLGALPKQNTRTVGVNVNISLKPETQKEPSTALKSLTQSAAALANLPSTSSQVKQQKSVDSKTSNHDDSQAKLNLAKQAFYGKKLSHSESVPCLTQEPFNSQTKNYSKSTENVASLGAATSFSNLPQMVRIPNSGLIQTSLPVKFRNVSPNVGIVHSPHTRLNYVVSRTPNPVRSETPMQIRMNRLPPPGTVLVSSIPNNLVLKRPGFRAIPIPMRHPAPLPAQPKYLSRPNEHPPKPMLTLTKPDEGVSLTWNMPTSTATNPIENYEIYSYEETKGPIDSSLWKKVGAVKALALPMACTLTQCAGGRRYHFALRACDNEKRLGPFSDIASILLPLNSK